MGKDKTTIIQTIDWRWTTGILLAISIILVIMLLLSDKEEKSPIVESSKDSKQMSDIADRSNETNNDILTYTPEQVKDPEGSITDTSKMYEASFKNGKYNYKYYVQYKIFNNQNHPNGYIIIHNVSFTDENGSEYMIVPVYCNHPEMYISTIHSPAFSVETPEGERNLEDVVVRAIFRTAEAMIAAQIKVSPEWPDMYDKSWISVSYDAVKSAANRMNNRKYGEDLQ